MTVRRYWVTVAAHPLRIYDDESEGPTSRIPCASLSRAVVTFTHECEELDTGCVQLWDGEREAGCLYL